MLAIIKTGGKQYAVKAGQTIKVEKIDGKKGDSITINDVLAVTDSSSHDIGNPLLNNASVVAKIVDQIKDKKIIVFKKRKRQNYRSTSGHRQHLTILKIESIKNGQKKSSPIKDEKTKSVEPKKKKETNTEISKDKKPIKKLDNSKKTTKKTIVKKKTTKKTTKKKIG